MDKKGHQSHFGFCLVKGKQRSATKCFAQGPIHGICGSRVDWKPILTNATFGSQASANDEIQRAWPQGEWPRLNLLWRMASLLPDEGSAVCLTFGNEYLHLDCRSLICQALEVKAATRYRPSSGRRDQHSSARRGGDSEETNAVREGRRMHGPKAASKIASASFSLASIWLQWC